MSEPSCYWCLRDPVNGISVEAGFFRLRGAVDAGLALLNSQRPLTQLTKPWLWLVIEPWFQTQEDEFRFWAEWWAWQERSSAKSPGKPISGQSRRLD